MYARVSTRGGNCGAAQPRLMRGCGACAGTDTSYGARKTVHLLERVCGMTDGLAGCKLLARGLVMYVLARRGDTFVVIRLHTLLILQVVASAQEFGV